MKNEQIIFNARVDLMEKGIIGTTGRSMEFENEDGEKITMPEPEEIHTYAGWKKLGYQVMKGQKAIASFHIWKHVKKKKKEEEKETEIEKMFLTEAHFFTVEQVKPITT